MYIQSQVGCLTIQTTTKQNPANMEPCYFQVQKGTIKLEGHILELLPCNARTLLSNLASLHLTQSDVNAKKPSIDMCWCSVVFRRISSSFIRQLHKRWHNNGAYLPAQAFLARCTCLQRKVASQMINDFDCTMQSSLPRHPDQCSFFPTKRFLPSARYIVFHD